MKTHLRKMATLFLILMIPFMGFSQRAPERVEPPFWWSGMKHSELQLLIYGDNVGNLRPAISYPGLEIKAINLVQNPDYLFLTLDIADTQPGTFTINLQDEGRTVLRYNYELRERAPGAAEIQGFDASDVIYLFMPDRFANGNPDNDEMPGMLEGSNPSNPDSRMGGDIQGIIDNLDYFTRMGFTALWINPLIENNQPEWSYHGYATTDMYKIDPRFGTNEDYVRLIDEAEERGIKIIKDLIFNHVGNHHWFIKDLPDSSWIHNWDEYTRTTYRITTIVDPHASEMDTKLMTKGWFDRHMPDLNQDNPLLATYLIQNSVWWIEYAGIKGIRMDTQAYANKEFMADWGKYVMTEYPNFNIVGESWIGVAPIVSYFQGGEEQFDGYNSHIPSVFDFTLYDAIGQGFSEGQGWVEGMMRLYNTLSMDFLYADPYNLVVFGDNHDTDRLLTRVQDRPEKAKLALAFVFTTRGIPQMYTGTELLNSAREGDGHGLLRSKFPGGWEGDTINAFTGEGLTSEQKEMQNYISNILQFRKTSKPIQEGKLLQFVPENNVYTYFRYHEDESVMVVINSNENDQQVDITRFAEGTKGFTKAKDIISGKTFNQFDTWNVPANTAMILELE